VESGERRELYGYGMNNNIKKCALQSFACFVAGKFIFNILTAAMCVLMVYLSVLTQTHTKKRRICAKHSEDAGNSPLEIKNSVVGTIGVQAMSRSSS
jgi:hypothetical protein